MSCSISIIRNLEGSRNLRKLSILGGSDGFIPAAAGPAAAGTGLLRGPHNLNPALCAERQPSAFLTRHALHVKYREKLQGACFRNLFSPAITWATAKRAYESEIPFVISRSGRFRYSKPFEEPDDLECTGDTHLFIW